MNQLLVDGFLLIVYHTQKLGRVYHDCTLEWGDSDEFSGDEVVDIPKVQMSQIAVP